MGCVIYETYVLRYNLVQSDVKLKAHWANLIKLHINPIYPPTLWVLKKGSP
jgi:hypothetical protein